jgi:spore maturation protein CgeB
MRFVFFTHSLVSDWNHGNAHFLRGTMRALQALGHDAQALEPEDGWSRANLVRDHGAAPFERFRRRFAGLRTRTFRPLALELDEALDGADVVIVHEWNEPALVAAIGRHRSRCGRYLLFFHDTHHRAATAPEELDRFDLEGYDGVLAFGEVIRQTYLRRGWAARAWVWHEAADVALFHPLADEADDGQDATGDVVWIGNWGDDERSAELAEFVLEPVAELGLRATVHGVRYPREALEAIARAGARYGGWLPNDAVPAAFARHRFTVHVPRRPYVDALNGIPTIRVFEALACGIPLLCAPWRDTEGLFRPGDFRVAANGAEMKTAMREVLNDPAQARAMAERGLQTIRSRHTCAHRVRELLAICTALDAPAGR